MIISRDEVPKQNSNENEISQDEKEEEEKEIEGNEKAKQKQEPLKKVSEIEIFDIDSDILNKKNCTAFYLGLEPVRQQCFTCSLCIPTRKFRFCKYCYDTCHRKCHEILEKNYPEQIEREKLKPEEFACYCGIRMKHIPKMIKRKDLISCQMMHLDIILSVNSYFCTEHNIIICCICSVVCHKNCNVRMKDKFEEGEIKSCNCKSEYHTTYNEIGLSFPIEEYKNKTGVKIWPIQIMNILFGTKNIFSKMTQAFREKLEAFNNEVAIMMNRDEIDNYLRIDNGKEEQRENEMCKEFYKLLELFSNSFNKNFKTFYYHEEMLTMFPYKNIFILLKGIRPTNNYTSLMAFRLLFIMHFIHLRRDFQIMKSLTTIDFLSSSIIERLKYKVVLNSKNIFTEHLNKKYKILNGFPLKNFAITEICDLIIKGMEHISIEENQDEFEIGLKLITFLIKHLFFDKEDLILLIYNLEKVHEKLVDYILSEKNNIYSLIEIINFMCELYYMICVSYNDLTVEEYIIEKGIIQFRPAKINGFIHEKSSHGEVLFRMIIKNCEVIKKHYLILRKPETDKRSNEEIKREKLVMQHKLLMQQKILSETTGVKMKFPDNGGLFTEKILLLFNESLEMFSLADNSYQKQLSSITKEDLIDYYTLREQIKKPQFFRMVFMSETKYDSNILFHLKISIETLLLDLFTSSFDVQKKFRDKLKIRMLNAIDLIYENLNALFSKVSKQKKHDTDKKEQSDSGVIKEMPKEKDEKEKFQQKTIKKISKELVFMKHHIFKHPEEGKKNLNMFINCFIYSHIDEIFSKTLFFLSNKKFPNLLNEDIVKLIFAFLKIFLLTKSGIQYFITGKNLVRIYYMIKCYSFASEKKKIDISTGRTLDFNITIMGLITEFLLSVIKSVKTYNLSLKKHKILHLYHKKLMSHLNNYREIAKKEHEILEFKRQLLSCIKIFFLLSDDFENEIYNDIKTDFINLLASPPHNLLASDNFSKYYNAKRNNEGLFLQDFSNKKTKKIDLGLFYSFFSMITKNTFYIYKNDIYRLKEYSRLYRFIDLNLFKKIFAESIDITLNQKAIVLKFLRTFYLLKFIYPVDYANYEHQLTNKEYKSLIISGYVKEPEIVQFLSKKNKCNIDSTRLNEMFLKYEKISNIEIIIELYIKELKNGITMLKGEKAEDIYNYIKELLFGIKHISDFLYQENKIVHKIIPSFYKLTILLFEKVNVIKEILTDIKNEGRLKSDKYEEKEDDDINITMMKNRSFDIFNIGIIYKNISECLYKLFSYTKVDETFKLNKFLKDYDKNKESNFTPFSLSKTKDYEYFYENDSLEEEEALKDPTVMTILSLNESFISQFTSLTQTNFLSVITNLSNMSNSLDCRQQLVDYFQSFLNSTNCSNWQKFRTLLCILTKLCFYDSQNMQLKFEKMLYDKYFFNNFNHELTYKMVLAIEACRNFELFEYSQNLIDTNKLIIQFLQLLGEGFNTTFHRNIFFTLEIVDKKGADEKNHGNKEEGDDDSSNDYFIVDDELIEATAKAEVKKIKFYKPEIPVIEVKKNIYDVLIKNLILIYILMDTKSQIESEMPFDRLSIITCNIVDFLIEYIQSVGEINEKINTNLTLLFLGEKKDKNVDQDEYAKMFRNKGILNLLKLRVGNEEEPSKLSLRKKMLAFLKIKYSHLLMYFLQTGKRDDFVMKMKNRNFGPLELFMEIVYYFTELLRNLKEGLLEEILSIDDPDSIAKELTNLYIFEEKFRFSIEFDVVVKLYNICKAFEELYNMKLITKKFEQIDENLLNFKKGKEIKEMQKKAKKNSEIPKVNEEENSKENDTPYKRVEKKYNTLHSGINSQKEFWNEKKEYDNDHHNLCFQFGIYKFLESLVLKVEIKEEESEGEEISKEFGYLVLKKIKSRKDSEHSMMNLGNGKKIKLTFYTRPYLTFFLSMQSKSYFEQNVDRTNATTKYINLTIFSDYFAFEMLYNQRLIGSNKVKQVLSNIRFEFLEVLNYLFIIAQNISTIIHYFRRPSLSANEYEILATDLISEVFIDNYLIAFFHIVYSSFCLFLWFYFKFILCFQRNLMLQHNKNFIFRKNKETSQNLTNPKIVKLFKGEENILSVLIEINSGIGLWNALYTGIVESILINREICFFIYTEILNIVYILSNNTISIVLPTIFIFNLSVTLFDIFKAFKMKLLDFFILLLFTYVLIYIFMWFSFFYLREEFDFDDVIEFSSGVVITEPFCKSTIQCLLFMIWQGERAGGGIGDLLPKISYYNDPPLFYLRFFYDILFHIIIIWIMGNFFSGIIVDTFAGLRDINWNRENDINNVCYICQMTRDDCLKKNVNFDQHITKEHDVWKYVYFLIHLHLQNSNEFNRVENSVWEKLIEKNFGWVPIHK